MGGGNKGLKDWEVGKKGYRGVGSPKLGRWGKKAKNISIESFVVNVDLDQHIFLPAYTWLEYKNVSEAANVSTFRQSCVKNIKCYENS